MRCCSPSLRPAAFPPPSPPPMSVGFVRGFIGIRSCPTPRPFPGSFVSSTSCRGLGSPKRLRARRGLPGSDAILSCVMGSSTTAERQGLAWRPRTFCLRLCQRPRPLRHCAFRGSITHPTRSLCKLRNRRRRRPRNTRYRAPATAYPRRTCTGWITPASWRSDNVLNSFGRSDFTGATVCCRPRRAAAPRDAARQTLDGHYRARSRSAKHRSAKLDRPVTARSGEYPKPSG
ncbi:hypothetical protein SAMN05519103_00533 [Rhizobiales bacterium GAS113]|nr:hypothetical protein SAMN05519103_00533 [Rhizobiales bacterium GAS113]